MASPSVCTHKILKIELFREAVVDLLSAISLRTLISHEALLAVLRI